MHGSATIASAAALLAAAATAAQVSPRQAGGGPCKDVHVFLARGNNEPYPGRQGKLVEAICSGLDSCDYEDIQFYNPLESPYCGSVMEGAANGIKQINAYNERCPDAKLVVSGYSQGGHVLGDVLGGGGGVFFQDCVQKPNAPLGADTPAAKKIVAALIFGDTRHTANQPYSYLDGGDKDGLFPRPANQLAELAKYTGVLRNYCDATDPICAQGDVVDNHLNYFDLYSESAGAWVREMVSKAGGSASSSSTAESSTATSKAESSTESTSSTMSSTSTSTSESSSASSTTSSSAESSASETSTESASETSSTQASSTASAEESASSADGGNEPATTTVTEGSDLTPTGAEESAATSDDADSGVSGRASAPLAALIAFVGLFAL